MNNRQNVYLSIDLDYWGQLEHTTDVKHFFKRVFKLGLPLTVACYHHHLVNDINDHIHLKRVLNVDFHSDISEQRSNETLREGNWANFVQNRHNMTFEWRYPSKRYLGQGYCHSDQNPFEKKCTSWSQVIKKQGLVCIPWSKIGAIGVCLSPGWLEFPENVTFLVERLPMSDWWDHYWSGGKIESEKGNLLNGTGMFAPRLITSDHVNTFLGSSNAVCNG